MKVVCLMSLLCWAGISMAKEDLYISVLPEVSDFAKQRFPNQYSVIKEFNDNVIAVIDSDIDQLLSEEVHHHFKVCGGYIRYDNQADAMKSVARLESLGLQQVTLADYTIDQQSVVNPLLSNVSENRIQRVIRKLSSFHTRASLTSVGREATFWLRNYWREISAHRNDIDVQVFEHSWRQPSLVAQIRGKSKPDEYIVVGGHIDSLNYSGAPDHAPGADDNASGMASVTEIFRVLSKSGYQPEKTIVFIGYALEEGGLHGSKDIATTFADQSKVVHGVLQLDMTNWTASPSTVVYLIENNTSAAQNDFLKNLLSQYSIGQGVVYNMSGGSSDHASWSLNGYTASFPFETNQLLSGRIHTINDTIGASGDNANHSVKFVKLGVAYVVELDR